VFDRPGYAPLFSIGRRRDLVAPVTHQDQGMEIFSKRVSPAPGRSSPGAGSDQGNILN